MLVRAVLALSLPLSKFVRKSASFPASLPMVQQKQDQVVPKTRQEFLVFCLLTSSLPEVTLVVIQLLEESGFLILQTSNLDSKVIQTNPLF